MKTITIRFFAVFRESAGLESLEHETSASSLRDLFREIAALFPKLNFESAALVAVNDAMTTWDRDFEDGDEVLFFPPVAGG